MSPQSTGQLPCRETLNKAQTCNIKEMFDIVVLYKSSIRVHWTTVLLPEYKSDGL